MDARFSCTYTCICTDVLLIVSSQQSAIVHIMGEDKSRQQRDIKELFSCKLGIESAKITERKVSENRAIKAIEKASTLYVARIKWNS